MQLAPDVLFSQKLRHCVTFQLLKIMTKMKVISFLDTKLERTAACLTQNNSRTHFSLFIVEKSITHTQLTHTTREISSLLQFFVCLDNKIRCKIYSIKVLWSSATPCKKCLLDKGARGSLFISFSTLV